MFADGSLGVRRIWWLLQCSHLMVPLCIVVCPVGARLVAPPPPPRPPGDPELLEAPKAPNKFFGLN